MTQFSIMVDLGEALPAGSSLTKEAFPHLSFAVQRIAEAALARWQGFARGEQMPDGRTIGIRSGTYLRSIQLARVNDFTAEVYSTLPYASAIEEGAPARDMKRILGSSWKVRVNKQGKRYLIIPFRHDTPGSVMGNPMPSAVHEWWQQPGQTASKIISAIERTSGALGSSIVTRKQMTVPGRTYSWGSRLTKGTLQGMGLDDRQVRRLTGMVNFREAPHGEGARHSSYITFRVMSEDSKGWIAPARDGYWPARVTADELRPVAEEAFQKAMAADIQAMLTPA